MIDNLCTFLQITKALHYLKVINHVSFLWWLELFRNKNELTEALWWKEIFAPSSPILQHHQASDQVLMFALSRLWLHMNRNNDGHPNALIKLSKAGQIMAKAGGKKKPTFVTGKYPHYLQNAAWKWLFLKDVQSLWLCAEVFWLAELEASDCWSYERSAAALWLRFDSWPFILLHCHYRVQFLKGLFQFSKTSWQFVPRCFNAAWQERRTFQSSLSEPKWKRTALILIFFLPCEKYLLQLPECRDLFWQKKLIFQMNFY